MATAQDVGVERECPHCGSAAERGQEYCLQCGGRLPADPLAARRPPRRLAGGPGLALLATGAIALVAASAVAALQLTERSRPPIVATSPQPSVPPTTQEQPPAESPEPTTPPATTAARPPAQRKDRPVEWPAGTSGWTLVLASIPAGPGNRAIALRQARDAIERGLEQVGVLTSSGFSSLHPGYLVVFSGVYANRSAAEQARSRAGTLGYDAAYTREIVP